MLARPLCCSIDLSDQLHARDLLKCIYFEANDSKWFWVLFNRRLFISPQVIMAVSLSVKQVNAHPLLIIKWIITWEPTVTHFEVECSWTSLAQLARSLHRSCTGSSASPPNGHSSKFELDNLSMCLHICWRVGVSHCAFATATKPLLSICFPTARLNTTIVRRD